MLGEINHYNYHTLMGFVSQSAAAFKNRLIQIVNSVALQIFVELLISLPLLYLQPNLFALGFAIGLFFDKNIRVLVQKVDIVFQAHQTLLARALLFVGGGILAIYTNPTSLIFATLYYSAKLGVIFYKGCEARYKNYVKPEIVPPGQLPNSPQHPVADP